MSRAQRRVSPGRRRTQPSDRKRSVAANSAEGRTYKIGEAADILGLKAYVLRFWESEFPMLRPGHTASKHRVYSDEDLERLKLVKRLLHEERLTIQGAKMRLKEMAAEVNSRDSKQHDLPLVTAKTAEQPVDSKTRDKLREIRRDLESLLKIVRD